MDLELSPAQPVEVAAAVSGLISVPAQDPDPWWRAGIEEALYGEGTARPRNTLGADLA
jgi:hypothetical protein